MADPGSVLPVTVPAPSAEQRGPARWRDPAVALLAVAVAVVLLLIGLAIAGYAPTDVASTWLSGALGSGVRRALSLQEAGPLLMTGLAVAIAFRAGALNIGGEGQFLLGSVAMIACGTAFRIPGPAWFATIVALTAGALAGAAWAGLAWALERWRGVPLVLSTILLNFIAVYAVSLLVHGVLQDPLTVAPQTAEIPEGMRLPVLATGSKLHLGVAFAAALAVALWLVFERTVFGFELGVVGMNPSAARLAGMPVARRRFEAMLLSGGVAGLGGAFQQAGVTYYMSDSSASYGYAGVAVALLGRLHPLGVAAAAVFFGMLDTGSRNLERVMDVPHDLGDVAKGLAVLAVLVAAAVFFRQARVEAS